MALGPGDVDSGGVVGPARRMHCDHVLSGWIAETMLRGRTMDDSRWNNTKHLIKHSYVCARSRSNSLSTDQALR